MNLGTELTKTASAVLATLAPDADYPEPPTLDECKEEMLRAYAEFQEQAGNAIRAACALGTAAALAKQMLNHGEFTPWVKKNFPFTEQWVRTCVRAAEAWQLSLTAPAKHAKAIADATTVEKLAALVNPLKGKEPGVRKLAPPPRVDDTVQDVTPRAPAPSYEDKSLRRKEDDLDRRAAALDAKETRLNALEEALNARAAALDERERNLALVAPAVADADPIAVAKAAKLKHDAAQRAKADAKRGIVSGVGAGGTDSPKPIKVKKAVSSPATPSQKAPNGKVEGVGTVSEKTAPADDQPGVETF